MGEQNLADVFSLDIIFPLINLSMEANAIGRYTIFPKQDSATVTKDHFNLENIDKFKEIDFREEKQRSIR